MVVDPIPRYLFLLPLLFIGGILFGVNSNLKTLLPHDWGNIGSQSAPTIIPWQEYQDDQVGFSLQLPSQWKRNLTFPSTNDVAGVESVGITIHPFTPITCTTARDYISQFISEKETILRVRFLSENQFEGFMIENRHLTDSTPGPEAYIFNCPTIIRLGFNPTGVEEGNLVFERILSSVKVWKVIQHQ